MKKTIQATSKSHKWPCGEMFKVRRFLDAGGRTRFQIVRKQVSPMLISKRAIKAIANDEYTATASDAGLWGDRYYYLSIRSPFGRAVYWRERQRAVSIAKSIMRELKIK